MKKILDGLIFLTGISFFLLTCRLNENDPLRENTVIAFIHILLTKPKIRFTYRTNELKLKSMRLVPIVMNAHSSEDC